MLTERLERLERADHPLAVTEVEDGVIVPPLSREWNDCCVTNRHGAIVDGSVMEAEEEFLRSVASLGQVGRVGQVGEGDEIREGTVLFAGYYNSHWGHFLVDTLSRLWALFREQGAPRVDKIVFCLHEGEKPFTGGNIGAALRLLGIADKIEFISRPTRYRRVVVGEIGVYPRSIFATDVRVVYDRLREAALREPPTAAYSPRIYMSRSRLPKAVKNEAGIRQLDTLMKAWGYSVIHPQEMSLTDLVHALDGAEEVAALSGTLPHNLLLGRDGTRLVILEKYPTLNNYQPGVDRLRRLQVTPIDCGAFIRPVSAGLGPFIIYPTDQLQAWACDHEKIIPAPLTDRRRREYLRKFFRQFRRNYGERWVMPWWLVDETAICCEAYRLTEQTFGEWLSGLRPLTLRQALSPRRIARWLRSKMHGR